jgi:hypothetical protein
LDGLTKNDGSIAFGIADSSTWSLAMPRKRKVIEPDEDEEEIEYRMRMVFPESALGDFAHFLKSVNDKGGYLISLGQHDAGQTEY